MTVLQDRVSCGQAHPGQLQLTLIPWLADPSLVTHQVSPIQLQSSQNCPSLIEYSFFSLPILSLHFSTRIFVYCFSNILLAQGLFRCKLLGKTSLPVIFKTKLVALNGKPFVNNFPPKASYLILKMDHFKFHFLHNLEEIT